MISNSLNCNVEDIYEEYNNYSMKTTNGNNWSKVLSTYELVNNIDANINGNNIATTKFVDSYLVNKLCGDINVPDYLENGYEVPVFSVDSV